MAKKKSSAIVFSGNNETAPVYQEEQKESPPPYEDTEVRYQGFSKFSIGNGKYGLKYQNKFYSYITIASSSNAQSVQIIGKNRAIITDLIIAFVDTGAIPTTTTRRFIIGRMEGISGTLAEEVFSVPCFKPVDTSATGVGMSGNTIVLHFNTPVVVQGKSDISCLAGRWSENGTEVKASFIGFLEA